MSFLLETITILLGIVTGLFTLKGPTLLFLKKYKAYWPEEFSKRYPHKKWVPIFYKAYSIIGWITALICIPSWFFDGISTDNSSLDFFAATAPAFALTIAYLITVVGLFNGLFELIIAVSPIPVFLRQSGIKKSNREKFTTASDSKTLVRKVGLLRLCLGLSMLMLIFFKAQS
jgi:hypothetical protein